MIYVLAVLAITAIIETIIVYIGFNYGYFVKKRKVVYQEKPSTIKKGVLS